MLESRGEARIACPAEVIFDYLADMRNEPEWLPGASDVEQTSAGEIGPGTTFTGTYARAGRVSCELSAFDRPRALTIHGEAKGMSFDDEISLREIDGETQLTATMRTMPKGMFKLVAPMMGRVIDRQFQANWDRLKARLEASPAD